MIKYDSSDFLQTHSSGPVTRLMLSASLLLLLGLPGCSLVQAFFASLGVPEGAVTNAPLRDSTVMRLEPTVRPMLDRLLQSPQASLIESHSSVDTMSARFKRRLALAVLKGPWEGFINLERQGLLLAELAEGRAVNLPALLDVLEAGMDRTSAFNRPISIPAKATAQELITFMIESLEEASIHREKALANLTEDERRFLFSHAQTIVEQFTPQISSVTDVTIAQAQADQRFAELLEEQVDYANLMAAAQVLARLANEPWLKQLAGAFDQSLPRNEIPAGITGDVLLAEATSYGMIVIGGSGPNTYELDHRFALIVDLGGDDLYRGLIAASAGIEHGNAVIIDMSGNDTYDSAALGLATGRLGVGLLIDEAGDDVYQLEMGSGGAGFGGLGILFDAKGNDLYMGTRLTQGAAIGGLGLLFDAAGNDRYASHGFALGFGGPQGVGAVIDYQGDDEYQCGNKYPSAYNDEDAPNGKPGDPMFQYDCFGLGTGSGRRILTKRPEWQAYDLAGGWGLLLDVGGNDRYRSANFSQGHGYFFGAGAFLDLSGNDEYFAARYGHGSSAHYGVGFFTDRQGADHYESTGPFYNGGVAWDHGMSMMIDAGIDPDRYIFQSTDGLGKADYSGWGLFVDEGGNDSYQTRDGYGLSSQHGIGGFFDLKGIDTYKLPPSTAEAELRPADGRVHVYPSGGLFVDR
ncbi:MAG: uncharacterized protein K0S79_2602 [Nitrospira sp.]|nr:uncharacterized protein [Nitrospira sp.]